MAEGQVAMSLVLRLVLSLLIPLVLASSCTKKEDLDLHPEGLDLPPGEEVIEFPKGVVRIKDELLSVEVAQTPAQRSRGLMYRKQLLQGHGMLFIFANSEYLNFYMKNTFIPLSIAFMDQNQTIVDIQDMTPAQEGQQSFPIYISKKEAMYALEVPMGWFRDRGIGIGDQVQWSF